MTKAPEPAAPSSPGFTLTSNTPTTKNTVTFSITAADSDITGYYISESAMTLDGSEGGWTASAPSSYTLASYGTYTLYLYVKNSAGKISSAATITVQYVQPGTEITDGWPYTKDGNNDSDQLLAMAISSDKIFAAGAGANIQPGNSKLSHWMEALNFSGVNQWTVQNFHTAAADDRATALLLSSSGHVYTGGYWFKSLTVSNEWWAKKFNTDGTEVTSGWNKELSIFGSDQLFSLAEDSSGNIYIAGISQKNPSGERTLTLAKYDANGNALFSPAEYIQIDCTTGKQHILNKLIIDTNNSVIYWIGSQATSSSPVHYTRDWCIQKTDLNGNLVDNISGGGNFPIIVDANSLADDAKSAVLDSSGNLYVVGFGTDVVGSGTGKDWWIKKYSSSGTELWNRQWDSGNGDDIAKAVVIQSGYLYVAGEGASVASGSTSADWWIKKLNLSDGTEVSGQWDVKVDGGRDGTDNVSAIVTDGNGYFYVGGYGQNIVGTTTNNDWIIRKFIDEN